MKSFIRKVLSTVVLAATALSLASCALPKLSSIPPLPDLPAFPSRSQIEETAAKASAVSSSDEFTYVSDYERLGIDVSSYLQVLFYTDTGFYCTWQEVTGDHTPEGVVPEYEGQYWDYESRILFVSYDGSVTPLTGYSPIPRPSASDGQYGFSSQSFLNGLTVNSTGNLVAVEAVTASWCRVPGAAPGDDDYWGNYSYLQQYYIRVLAPDGTEISTHPIEASHDESVSRNLVMDRNGYLLLSGDARIKAVDMRGVEQYSAVFSGDVDFVVRTPGGRIFIAMCDGKGKNFIHELDEQTGRPVSSFEVPLDATAFYAGGGSDLIYYTSGVNFYSLDPDSGITEKLFSWIDLDINTDELYSVGILSGGTIVGVNSIYDIQTESFSFEKFSVRKVPTESAPKRTILTLATQSLTFEAKKAITSFNRENPDYRIEIRDYSVYNTPDNPTAGLTKLTAEVLGGRLPDILDLKSMPVSRLAANGSLENLYPYLDADSGLDRSAFFPSVLSAFEKDGKLVSTVSGFSLNAVIGRTSLVGDNPGWTYSEYNTALTALRDASDYAQPFSVFTTRDSILSVCLGLEMDRYVNWSTGECSFDSASFRELLDFAGQFPEAFDPDDYKEDKDLTPEHRTAIGEQMLQDVIISSFDDIFFLKNYFGGRPTTFIGYPVSSGSGNYISVQSGFAMTSKCADKDAAWKFLRIMFTEKYQKSIPALPAEIHLFEQELEEAMTMNYQKYADGSFLLDAAGEKIPVAKSGAIMADGKYSSFYAVTMEEAADLMELIDTTSRVMDCNSAIFEIISEQAVPYYRGQTTADEAVSLIQSKAGMYLKSQQ